MKHPVQLDLDEHNDSVHEGKKHITAAHENKTVDLKSDKILKNDSVPE